MEKITKHNYEAFYLDYLEGNLSEFDYAMLLSFLDDNLDLKAELDDDILDIKLIADTKGLNAFEKEDLKYFDCLKGEICLNNVDDFIISDLENDISVTKKKELTTFITEHNLKTSQQYFYATQLKADLNESYGNTTDLKKKGTIIPLFIKIASVAAIGLLFFNVLKSNPATENYSPRHSKFALNHDTKDYKFEFENINNSISIEKENVKIYIPSDFTPQQSSDLADVIKKENTTVDSVVRTTEKFEKALQNQIVNQQPKQITKKNIEAIKPINTNDDVAMVNSDLPETAVHNEIKLVDMYKPITSLTNSYTNLDVSFKKSTAESEYQVTTFKFGKFSFERKRRK